MAFLGKSTFTVRRYAGDTVGDDGVINRGATTSFTVTGTLVPFRDRDKQMLPEGIRTQATHRFYTNSSLLMSRDGIHADELLDDATGRWLEVVQESNWTRHTTGIPHRWFALAEPSDDGY